MSLHVKGLWLSWELYNSLGVGGEVGIRREQRGGHR